MELGKMSLPRSVLLLLAALSCACAGYKHPNRTQHSPKADDLVAYSGYLSALEEPGLCEGDATEPESYRFLWTRTFHPVVLVSIRLRSDAEARVVYKSTSGPGGYEFGSLAETSARSLSADDFDGSADDVELFIRAFRESAESSFWVLPYINDDGGIALDGAGWMVEGRKNGRCHIVRRRSPSEGSPFRRFCEWFLRVSGTRFDYFEVY